MAEPTSTPMMLQPVCHTTGLPWCSGREASSGCSAGCSGCHPSRELPSGVCTHICCQLGGQSGNLFLGGIQLPPQFANLKKTETELLALGVRFQAELGKITDDSARGNRPANGCLPLTGISPPAAKKTQEIRGVGNRTEQTSLRTVTVFGY